MKLKPENMGPLILIVDDRTDDIELTEIALKMAGINARTRSACTGEDALEFLQSAEQLPHVILLDLKMPGIGGIETLRRIRASDRLMNIPVVVLTASSLENDRNLSIDAGASAFLDKGINLKEFSRQLGIIITAWINKQKN